MNDGLLIHNVYFALIDRSPEARQRLLAGIRRHLPGHAGIVTFASGLLEDGLDREVNVRDWDVGLHIIFASRAAHDAYQESGPHHQFIAENKGNWRAVRVFDSVGMQSQVG